MTNTLLVDSHCHLSHPRFATDTPQTLQRAAAAGVGACVVPGVDLASSLAACALADAYPPARYAVVIGVAVGVHPQEVVAADRLGLTASVAELRQLAAAPHVVAIGEIGLDFSRGGDRGLQARWLQAQLELAAELHLPVIIHSRDAEAEIRQQLGDWVAAVSDPPAVAGRHGVLHAYTGTGEMGLWACASGFALGAGGIATFKREGELLRTLAELPSSHVVVETDAPYLAPEPVRGRRNEPAFARHVAACLARQREEPVAALTSHTTAAALQLFPRLAALVEAA